MVYVSQLQTPRGRLMDERRFLLEQLIPTSDRSEGSPGCIQSDKGKTLPSI